MVKKRYIKNVTVNCQLYDDSRYSNISDLLLENNKVIILENCFSIFNLYKFFIFTTGIILNNVYFYEENQFIIFELNIEYELMDYTIRNKKIIIKTSNQEDFTNNSFIFLYIIKNGGYFPPPLPFKQIDLILSKCYLNHI